MKYHLKEKRKEKRKLKIKSNKKRYANIE